LNLFQLFLQIPIIKRKNHLNMNEVTLFELCINVLYICNIHILMVWNLLWNIRNEH